MDIFNFDYILPVDIMDVEYKGYTISVAHPGITISYKAKYAFRNQNYKHYEDLKHLIKNFQKYHDLLVPLWENKDCKRTIVDEGVVSYKRE
jgi:hypothetical protein